MKNVSQNNSYINGVVQIYVDPPPTPLIKSRLDLITERDYAGIKLYRNRMSEKLDMYEFKIDFSKWWAIIIPFVCVEFKYDGWSVRYAEVSIFTYSVMWWGTKQILNFRRSNQKHKYDVVKPGHIQFRYVIFPCQFIIQNNVCDAPWNE